MMQLNEFYVSKSELEMDLDIGDTGILMIPVEVITIDKETYLVRKAGKITAEGDFKAETTEQMRDKIGIVEETEERMSKEEDED